MRYDEDDDVPVFRSGFDYITSKYWHLFSEPIKDADTIPRKFGRGAKGLFTVGLGIPLETLDLFVQPYNVLKYSEEKDGLVRYEDYYRLKNKK